MLDRGEQLDWFASVEIWLEAVLCVLGFLPVHRPHADGQRPFIDPALFRDHNFVIGLC